MSATSLRIGVPIRTRAAAVPAACAVVTVVCAATGLTLHVANAGSATAVGVTDWWAMQLVAAVAYGGTGTWLALARPRLAVGWLLLASGTIQAVSFAAVELGVRTLDAGEAASASWVLWVAQWAWSLGLSLVGLIVPLLLPDGRLLSPRWRPALAAGVVAVTAGTVDWALTPYADWSSSLTAAGASNPVGSSLASSAALDALVLVPALAAVGAGFASLAIRWRRAAGTSTDERQQLKWIFYGLTLTAVLYAAGFVLGPVLTALAMVPLPAAVLLAALRYGLWDVDVVISRSVAYGVLLTGVVAVYVAAVALLGGLIGRTTGAPIVATAVVAVLAEPALRRVRTTVNRIVHGERDDPVAALARLGARLEAAQDAATVAEQLLPEVVTSTARALRLPYVAVVLADGGVVSTGTPGAVREEVELTYGAQHVGALVVTPRAGGLGRAGRRLLTDLARRAGVAAHSVLLERELRRSREALVSAREEERRRIYRELHDGLGPSLAALALRVETARELVDSDAERATRLLDEALPRLKATVSDVRTVVHGLRPAALDDLGLAGALRELGGRFIGPRLAVDVAVHLDPAVPLPAAVEVAAYRIAAEALANAARHAGAGAVRVAVEQTERELCVVVDDDGNGISPRASAGVGLASMRERAGELGGMLDVGPGPGGVGARVSARLPVATR